MLLAPGEQIPCRQLVPQPSTERYRHGDALDAAGQPRVSIGSGIFCVVWAREGFFSILESGREEAWPRHALRGERQSEGREACCEPAAPRTAPLRALCVTGTKHG